MTGEKSVMNEIAQEDFLFKSLSISFHEWMEGRNKLLSFVDGYPGIQIQNLYKVA